NEFSEINNRLSQYATDLNLGINIIKIFDKKHDKNDQELDFAEIRRNQSEILELMKEQKNVQYQQHDQLLTNHSQLDELVNRRFDSLKNYLYTLDEKNMGKTLLQDLLISFNDLCLEENIGSGSFGKVYRGTWSSRFQIVAIKTRNINHMDNEAEKSFFDEIWMICRIHFEHIISTLSTKANMSSSLLKNKDRSIASLLKRSVEKLSLNCSNIKYLLYFGLMSHYIEQNLDWPENDEFTETETNIENLIIVNGGDENYFQKLCKSFQFSGKKMISVNKTEFMANKTIWESLEPYKTDEKETGNEGTKMEYGTI
ncbi:unnamed protein product, partial [Didymodactylos carnosus]